MGSWGQPRDGNNATCYVLYDTAASTVTFFRLTYEFMSAAEKILNAGLSSRFAERLLEGQ